MRKIPKIRAKSYTMFDIAKTGTLKHPVIITNMCESIYMYI